jgi:type II secretion system protein N
MNPRLKAVLPWVGYPAFYLACFFLFAYLTFPFDYLKDRLVVEFANDQRQSGGNTRLEVDKLSSYWFSGFEAKGVRLVTPASTNPDGTKKTDSEMEVDQLTARVSILPLLWGRVTVSVWAKTLGGTLEATSSKKGKDTSFEMEFKDLNIGEFDPFVQTVGLPMFGQAQGKIDLTLPEGKLAKANGSIQMKLSDYAVGDGKTKIKDAIALPKMNIGELTFDADIKEGLLRIMKSSAAGQDLDLSVDGKITMRDPFAESQGDLYMKFRFADAYKSKSETTKTLFGAPGSSAPALFEMADPRIRQSKRSDGFYSWRAWGLLRALRFDPAPAGGVGGPGAPPPGGAGTPAGAVRGFITP